MALAGCPEYFLHHSNYKESMDRTSSRRSDGLIVPSFQRQANQNLPHHHDDDVDLEQLVNDMNSSMESVYSTQADTTLLLNNGHAHTPNHHHHHHQPGYPGPGQAHRRHTPTIAASSPSRDRLRHSQPMHIQAVRCLREEQQLRPASLPAIPNPFPELCSPAGSPVLSPTQASNNHPADWPVVFRSEQLVLTLAVGCFSFHYTTAQPGLSAGLCVCVCVCVCERGCFLQSHHYQSHAHTHARTEQQCVLLWKEVSDVSRMPQTQHRLPQRLWEHSWERLQVENLGNL